MRSLNMLVRLVFRSVFAKMQMKSSKTAKFQNLIGQMLKGPQMNVIWRIKSHFNGVLSPSPALANLEISGSCEPEISHH